VFSPAKYTESEVLVGYLDQQLVAIRAAAHGLSEQQARETPCRSALSIGGLVKHATYILQNRQARDDDPGAMPDEAGYGRFMGSFALDDEETLVGTLDAFDQACTSYLAVVRATDPAADTIAPPAPWDGVYTTTDSLFNASHWCTTSRSLPATPVRPTSSGSRSTAPAPPHC
jgi:hypothetical protein